MNLPVLDMYLNNAYLLYVLHMLTLNSCISGVYYVIFFLLT